MKILKKKNIPEGHEFKCEKCGCEFVAEKDEYWEDSGNTWSVYSTGKTLYCNCPECYKICKDTIQSEYNGIRFACAANDVNLKTVSTTGYVAASSLTDVTYASSDACAVTLTSPTVESTGSYTIGDVTAK